MIHVPFLVFAFVKSCALHKVGGRKDGYGAWTICTENLDKNSVVFSIGIGSDVSFDVEIMRFSGASVFCFDPTIHRTQFEDIVGKYNLTESEQKKIHFLPFGIGQKNDVSDFYRSTNTGIASLTSTPHAEGYDRKVWMKAPVMNIQTLMYLSRVNKINVLKIDAEGSEFEAFDNNETRELLKNNPPEQIAIEFHDRFVRKSSRAQVLQLLKQYGYVKRHVSQSKEEVLFLHKQLTTQKIAL